MSVVERIPSWLKTIIQAILRPLGVQLERISSGNRPAGPWFLDQLGPNCRWLDALRIRTVIDVGAHKGEFSVWALNRFPEAGIVSFEPLADCHAELQARFRGNPRFRAIQCALGDRDGVAAMHRSSFTPASSLLPIGESHLESFPFATEEGTERVVVRRMDEACAGLELPEPYLVKIDVQGGEEQMLDGAGQTLSRAAVLIVELSLEELYKGQALFDTMYRKISQLGFTYFGNVGQLLSPIDGRPLQVDCLFVRKQVPSLNQPT